MKTFKLVCDSYFEASGEGVWVRRKEVEKILAHKNRVLAALRVASQFAYDRSGECPHSLTEGKWEIQDRGGCKDGCQSGVEVDCWMRYFEDIANQSIPRVRGERIEIISPEMAEELDKVE